MLGPDEPRYSAIGRAMVETGDFVTPHLWGVPWFEKPPLLYWMNALGVSLGANAGLAARLPVALLSLFLVVLFWLIRQEFGAKLLQFPPRCWRRRPDGLHTAASG